MVDDTNTTEELQTRIQNVGDTWSLTLAWMGGWMVRAHRHRDSHLALRDGVHGTTHERCLEHDVSGDPALGDDLVCTEIDVPRQEEEVVVGEAAVLTFVHELLDGEPIVSLVGLEVLDGGGGVEVFCRHGAGGRESGWKERGEARFRSKKLCFPPRGADHLSHDARAEVFAIVTRKALLDGGHAHKPMTCPTRIQNTLSRHAQTIW